MCCPLLIRRGAFRTYARSSPSHGFIGSSHSVPIGVKVVDRVNPVFDSKHWLRTYLPRVQILLYMESDLSGH